MKFATKLAVLFSSVFLMSGLILIYFIYTSSTRTLEDQIEHRLKDNAFNIIDKMDRMFFERYADMKFLTSDPIISSRASTPEQITERLTKYQSSFEVYSSLSFFDLNRIRIADTSGKKIGHQNRFEGYWIDLARGKDFVMDIHESESLHAMVFHFVSIVKDKNGSPLGVVVSRMSIEKLHDIVSGASGIHESAEVANIDLIDGNGLLIYSNHNKKGILKTISPDWESVKTHLLGGKKIDTGRHSHMGTGEAIHVYVREQGYLDFRGNEWTLIMHVPTRIAFAPAFEIRNRMIVILSIIGGAGLLIIFLFSRTVTKPVRKLNKAAIQIGNGNLEVRIKIASKDEIGQLSASFNKMVGNLKEYQEKLLAEITERKQAEEALKESEEKYRTLFEESRDTVYMTSREGEYVGINQVGLDLLGYTKEEIMSINVEDTYADPEERLIFQQEIEQKRFVKDYEIKLRKKDGTKIDCLLTSTVRRANDGRILGYHGIVHDITERKQAEEELKKSKEMLENVTQGITESILLISKDFKVQWVNKTALDQTGYEMGDLLGNYCYKVTHCQESPCKPPHDQCPVKVFQETGNPVSLSHIHFDKRGDKKFIEVSLYPVKNEKGEVVQFVHVSKDITERKQVEEAREKLIRELEDALSQIKQLKGLLPICSYCKKIRDDRNYWHAVESYITEHSEAVFSHGVCPDCHKKFIEPQLKQLEPKG